MALLFRDPLIGYIDCTDVQPIIDHPLFQRLGLIKQLGLSHLIFRYATHTRFEHSIGAYGRTKVLTEIWRKRNIIDKEEARDLEIYGLIHDIGHGPYSHAIEGVTSINHDERGEMILEEIKKPIKQCGGNFDNIKKLFAHRNKLYKAVHDKNLGTEKFDYLDRDAYYTDSGRPKFGRLPYEITFKGGEILVPNSDELLDDALGVAEFYMNMYKNRYLESSSVVLQRLFKKMVYGMLKNNELTENQLWTMTDGELDGAYLNSKQEWIRRYGKAIQSRQWPKVAISIKQRRFKESKSYTSSKKKITTFVGMRRMNQLAKYFEKKPQRIESKERQIEEVFKLPEHSVLIVPITDSHRFRAQHIQVLTDGEINSLEKWRPDGVKRLNEIALSYMCLRIAVGPEYREKMACRSIAQEVVKLLLSEL